ncbi:hypothetical protein B5M42_011765 [Paenibacillus athensensis]|uniref:Beta-agarase n=1 Tax=Paenibacillus athensensis TaxID=1967502 RepID=A0A4Y8Q6N2_9BACL|nr:hypothetical protein [Paenibacillus athensensis]MCD1259507.1 hypothetical protein [Paenibacillus athensensis]
MQEKPSGYVTVQQRSNRWVLIDAQGRPFVSKGICHATHRGEKEPATGRNPYREAVEQQYPDPASWAADTAKQLRQLGFNSAGLWCSEELLNERLYHIAILPLAREDWQTGTVDDYFCAEFVEHADRIARETITGKGYASDPGLIGYCTGGEMRWGPDWRSPRSIVFDYLNFAADRPGKQAVIGFFRELYKDDIRLFNKHWKQRFTTWREALAGQSYRKRSQAAKVHENEVLGRIAKRYFRIAAETVRRYDPNHLLLGVRFLSSLTPRCVVEACGDYVDVVTVNHYQLLLGMEKLGPYLSGTVRTGSFLEEFHRLTGKPLLVSEFGYRVKERGTRRRYSPVGFPTFHSDRSRGKAALRFIRGLAGTPYTVGWHLFQWADQPPQGRFDGQNSRFGLVDVDNRLHTEYADYIRQANGFPSSV